jgi:hypothetical protein
LIYKSSRRSNELWSTALVSLSLHAIRNASSADYLNDIRPCERRHRIKKSAPTCTSCRLGENAQGLPVLQMPERAWNSDARLLLNH